MLPPPDDAAPAVAIPPARTTERWLALVERAARGDGDEAAYDIAGLTEKQRANLRRADEEPRGGAP